MQTASSACLPDGFMAAIWLGAEKPHQGVSTKNQAWQPAPNVCNSTTALGLRAGWTGNRVRSFCSGEQYDSDLALYYLRARYYNPSTGRFLSRDPKEFKPLKSRNNPVDSRKLHRYLYADGDPANRIDPRGTEDFIETALNTGMTSEDYLAVLKYELEPAEEELWRKITCAPIGALWAVENPAATVAEIMEFIENCEAGL